MLRVTAKDIWHGWEVLVTGNGVWVCFSTSMSFQNLRDSYRPCTFNFYVHTPYSKGIRNIFIILKFCAVFAICCNMACPPLKCSIQWSNHHSWYFWSNKWLSLTSVLPVAHLLIVVIWKKKWHRVVIIIATTALQYGMSLRQNRCCHICPVLRLMVNIVYSQRSHWQL